MEFNKIGVIGAGGWGTALAILLYNNGADVVLWSHDESIISNITNNHINSDYLRDVSIPEKIKVTTNPAELDDCSLIVNAIPTQYIRSAFINYKLPLRDKYIINGSKGVEINSLHRISEIFNIIAGTESDRFAVITGPSHAEEASRNMPTTVVTASEDIFFAKNVQNLFNSRTFRVYYSDDVIGCEIGGALKNVIAIAAGVIDGLGMGDNTKAALITRGLAEISRLGIAMGAKPLTFSGLSGLGDLFVTCNSRHSRNRMVGELIGRGQSLDEIISHTKMVAEGISTTDSAYHLSRRHNVEMPITEQMHKILFENISPKDAIHELMTRESKKEWWW